MVRAPLPLSAARYGLALLLASAAVGLRVLLVPILPNGPLFFTLFAAVAVTVWFGGTGPALLASVAGYLGINLFLVAPRGAVMLIGLPEATALAGYALACAVIILCGAMMHRAQLRAEASALDAAEQREWFRTTLASIGDAVITTDTLGRVTFMNAVAEELTGWPAAEARGELLECIFHIVNEQTRQPVENPANRSLREGTVVGLANHTVLIGRDGVEWPLDDSAAPIKDRHGVVSGVVLIFRDVTQRRQLERLQQDLQGELERQVADRTLALQRSEEQFRWLVAGGPDYAIFLPAPGGRG